MSNMLLVRRIATGIVVAAALAVLTLSLYLLWNARQWDRPALQTAGTSSLDARAQLFQDKLDTYGRRISDMETLVIILLGITGLYPIVFILTADFNARSVARQVERAMRNVKGQMGEAPQTDAQDAAERLHQVREQAHEITQELRAVIHMGVPLAHESQVNPRPDSATPEAAPVRETILVADDEGAIRAVVSQLLRRHGYTVLEALNGKDATKICQKHSGKIDLLITDAKMRETGRDELFDTLKQQHGDLKVLYVSGYTDDAGIKAGDVPPGTAFLQKPLTLDSLLDKVREILSQPSAQN